MRFRLWIVGLLLLGIGSVLLGGVHPAEAQSDSNFALQVTPSPLVANVKPGVTSELEIKIRNGGTQTEQLKIEPRSFSVQNETVTFNDTAPPDIDKWINFSVPNFNIQPGQWFSQKIRLNMPKDSGFSYYFALVVSRKNAPKTIEGGHVLKGKVAIFTLINVDRPGAVRKLDVARLTSAKRVYEYLPAQINLQLRNSGNTIVQPYGNIFIQRSGSKKPLTTLPVNEKKGYILPGNTRTLNTQWQAGFPVYKTETDDSGKQQKHLTWDWSQASNFRIGRYTAKVVAVYNDGERDVPVMGEISFWVVPWKTMILIVFVAILLWFAQRWRMKRHTAKAVKKALKARDGDQKS